MTIDRQVSLTNQIFNRYFRDNASCLVGSFEDEGYNLERKDPSREFWRLAQDIREGKVNTVIVSSEDRIFRGESAQLRGEITDLFRHHGVRLITSNSDTTYSRTETTSRLVSSITQELGAINKLETVKMLQHGRRRKLAEDERWFLTVVPYGLRCHRRVENHVKIYDYSIVEDEAQYVRDIFRLYVGEKPEKLRSVWQGRRLGATRIAQILNDNRVDRSAWIAFVPPGVATEGWDRQKVLRILKNATYAGQLTVTFSPTIRVAGYENIATTKTILVPAIVSQELFDRAQVVARQVRLKLLDDFQPRIETNWLHGLIECPKCGERLTGRLAARKLRYYGCPNFHGLFRADDLESQVEQDLVRILTDNVEYKKLVDATGRARSNKDERRQLETQLVTTEKAVADRRRRLEKLTVGWSDGTVDDDTYRSLSRKLRDEIDNQEAVQASLRRHLTDQERDKRTVTVADIRKALQTTLNSPEHKPRVMRLVATELLERVKIVKSPKVNLKGLSDADIKALYRGGRILPADLRGIGWTNKQIFSQLGTCGRKSKIDYTAQLHFKH